VVVRLDYVAFDVANLLDCFHPSRPAVDQDSVDPRLEHLFDSVRFDMFYV
jgi:hypothetical protein